MEMQEYFRSLTGECYSLRDRVRHFIGPAHWPTDGEWKESVLRSMIRRNCPDSVKIGRGFIVSHEHVSTQIDVLIYDASYPVLYRDGDLVFIPPASCLGVIEVKTSVTPNMFRKACEKIADVGERIRYLKGGDIFVGVFSYESRPEHFSSNQSLGVLMDVSNGLAGRIINHVALGDSTFLKYWKFNPSAQRGGPKPSLRPPSNYQGDYQRWHLYRMSNMAFGYFIHNALVSMTPGLSVDEENVYFPNSGKERMLIDECSFKRKRHRRNIY